MTLEYLRTAALDIFSHALRAVDARTATRNAINFDGTTLRVKESEFDLSTKALYVVGIGKAATSMCLGVNDVVGVKVSAGVVSRSTSTSSSSLPVAYRIFEGGHPLPNQQSLDAAQAAFELLERANRENAVVIFLVSGGGSAMLEWPVSNEITLTDLQQVNRQLVTCGATIAEINAVRRSISAVKGGALGKRAANAQIATLIVSDTNLGDESSVASGPTFPVSFDSTSAEQVIEKYGLTATLPNSVVSAIRTSQSAAQNERDLRAPVYVLLDNRVVLKAAAERATELGFSTVIDVDINEESVDEGSALLLSQASQISALPSCHISGGEFACRVRGTGRGGRNLETVLLCAIKLAEETEKSDHNTVVVSIGTDGIDGSSNAAGAIADELTIARAKVLGLDAYDYLQRSDSHRFFEALGDLIVTGPTGTNVRDLRLILRA